MSNYWERRQAQMMYEYMESAEKKADEIAKLYQKASWYLSAQADAVFDKYMDKHGLSENEARRLLNQVYDKTSLDEMLAKLDNGDKDESRKELKKKLEAPAYQARLDRFRKLQDQLDMVMMQIYKQEKQMSTDFYTELASESYYKSMYTLQQQADAAFSFSYVDAKTIDQVINSRWSGENYSSRIWKNTKGLAEDLKEQLLLGLVTGKTHREMAREIQLKYAAGASQARRLVRTESNFVATELNFKAYEEAGIKKYRYLATLDLKTSKICRELDGKIFPVEERKSGENCPPMHPWCRSTTVAVIREEWIKDSQRAAIDPVTHKRIMVPASMTYAEWYKKYVEGKPEAQIEEKKAKNRSADRTQYRKYTEVLGEEAPETLDEFQEMKYNEPEKWEELKGLKAYVENYPGEDRCNYELRKELKKLEVKGEPHINPSKIDTSAYTYDTEHINVERSHMVHREEAEQFVKNAVISITRWNGRFENFYSKDGAAYLDIEKKTIRTAFKSEQFDEKTLKMMEIVKKYGNKED